MSIKALVAKSKTGLCQPTPWAWTEYPFGAYRADGVDGEYHCSLHAVKQYRPTFAGGSFGGGVSLAFDDLSASKLIWLSASQRHHVAPCTLEEDQRIMLLTLQGGLDGTYSRIESVGAEKMFERSGDKARCPTAHLVVRLIDPNGYVFAETGRRSGVGTIDFFSWDGYRQFQVEEFEAYRQTRQVGRALQYSAIHDLRRH